MLLLLLLLVLSGSGRERAHRARDCGAPREAGGARGKLGRVFHNRSAAAPAGGDRGWAARVPGRPPAPPPAPPPPPASAALPAHACAW
eukprot:2217502-Rhodomonas_salina.1